MRKLQLVLFFLIAGSLIASACPICEKQQPKILQGITHGTGPQSDWDYVIIAACTIIVLLTLAYSIKFLARPGEQSGNHIKRVILNEA